MTDTQTKDHRIIASTISDSLEPHYDDFCETFGLGPCGAYCALKREQGWGQIAYVFANTKDGNWYQGFGHFVLWDDGILDFTNPHGETLEYSEFDLLDPDEMPELVDDDMIDWLRERIA